MFEVTSLDRSNITICSHVVKEFSVGRRDIFLAENDL